MSGPRNGEVDYHLKHLHFCNSSEYHSWLAYNDKSDLHHDISLEFDSQDTSTYV